MKFAHLILLTLGTACAGTQSTSLFDSNSFDSAGTLESGEYPSAAYSPENPRVDEVYPASAAAGSDEVITLSGEGLSPLSTLVFLHLDSGRRGYLPYNAADSKGIPLRDSADATAIVEFFVSPAMNLPQGDYEIVVRNPLGAESAPVDFEVK
jgi:hypothetical protein